jgi:hypothetical protein
MKYAVEMRSCAMICIPSFMKTGSGTQHLLGGYTDTQTGWRLHKSTFIYLFIFFQNKECRLKSKRFPGRVEPSVC